MSSASALTVPEGDTAQTSRRSPRTAYRPALAVVVGLQLAGLLVLSVHQWSRGALTLDFGIFHQASTMISGGDLSPFSTLEGHPFWQDQFNVGFWPVALVGWIFGSSLYLLVVQDLVIAASTWVLVTWVADICEKRLGRRPSAGLLIVAGAAALALVNPWSYDAAAFDFHMQPFAALFLLLAGRSFWRGARVSPWLWVAATLATGTSGGVSVLGLGLALVIGGRRRRRSGVVVVGAGIAWLLLILSLDAHRSTPLAATYGYLAGTAAVGTGVGGLWAVASGAVVHPGRVAHTLSSRSGDLYTLLASGGMVGILTGLGVGVAGLDILVNGLNRGSVFFALPVGGFQNLAAVLYLIVGSALFICWLARWGRPWAVLAALLAVAVLVQGVIVGAVKDAKVRDQWLQVSAPAGALIDRSAGMIPAGAEVVSSQGVVGRFAGRRNVFIVVRPHEGFRVCGNDVVFVLATTQGIEGTDPATIVAAERYLLRRPGARLLDSVPGLAVIELHGQRTGSTIVLPNVPPSGIPPSPMPCA